MSPRSVTAFAMVKTLCQRLVVMMEEIVLNVKMKTANTYHRQKCKSFLGVGICHEILAVSSDLSRAFL